MVASYWTLISLVVVSTNKELGKREGVNQESLVRISVPGNASTVKEAWWTHSPWNWWGSFALGSRRWGGGRRRGWVGGRSRGRRIRIWRRWWIRVIRLGRWIRTWRWRRRGRRPWTSLLFGTTELINERTQFGQICSHLISRLFDNSFAGIVSDFATFNQFQSWNRVLLLSFFLTRFRFWQLSLTVGMLRVTASGLCRVTISFLASIPGSLPSIIPPTASWTSFVVTASLWLVPTVFTVTVPRGWITRAMTVFPIAARLTGTRIVGVVIIIFLSRTFVGSLFVIFFLRTSATLTTFFWTMTITRTKRRLFTSPRRVRAARIMSPTRRWAVRVRSMPSRFVQ